MPQLSVEIIVRKNIHCGRKSELNYYLLKPLSQCWYVYSEGMSGYNQLIKFLLCSCTDTLNLKLILVAFAAVDLTVKYFIPGQLILAMLSHC